MFWEESLIYSGYLKKGVWRAHAHMHPSEASYIGYLDFEVAIPKL